MTAQRTARVSNSKPAHLKLYDYYNRVETSRLFYEPPQLKSCDICEKSDCDVSCGKGDFLENEISDMLKDASGGSMPLRLSCCLLSVILVGLALRRGQLRI